MRPLTVVLVVLCVSLGPSLVWAQGTPADCTPSWVAGALLDVFPPAPEEIRIASARLLGECRMERAVGALEAVIARDASSQVRLAAISSLAAIHTPRSLAALQQIAAEGPIDDRAAALYGLASLGQYTQARAAAVRPDEPARVRLAALDVLGSAPAEERPTLDELELVAQERGSIGGVAARMAASMRPPPPVEPPRQVITAPFAQPAESPQEVAARTQVEGPSARTIPPEPQVESPPARPDSPEPPSTVQTPVAEIPPADDKPLAVALATPPPPEPAAVQEPLVAPEPPSGPPSGTPLMIATSAVAGASMMTFLSELAAQDDLRVLMLVGTAGAVIGGGTAWGLHRFGVEPDLPQAVSITNTTAWGTLAGAVMYSGAGADDYKLKWGLLTAGEAVGLGAGIWSANRWHWTTGQVLFANSLVLGGALLDAGGKGLGGNAGNDPRSSILSPRMGPTRLSLFGTVPAMVGAAVVARLVDPSADDIHLMAASTMAGGLTGSLLSTGGWRVGLFTSDRGKGGLFGGLGLGYLGAVAVAPFVDVPAERTWDAGLAMLAGNAIGLGAAMALGPEDGPRWPLGAGLGGLVLGSGIFAAWPKLHPGDHAFLTSSFGWWAGSGSWLLASSAAGSDVGVRKWGGALAAAFTGATSGYLASQWADPSLDDFTEAFVGTGMGLSAGLGVARLGFVERGEADRWGVLAGAGVGFAGAALFAHSKELRGPDYLALGLGATYGGIAGAIIPSLSSEGFGYSRKVQGGAFLGAPLAAAIAAGSSVAMEASGSQVLVHGTAGLLGAGIGTGLGMIWRDDTSRAERIGGMVGPVAMVVASLALEHELRLEDGLNDSYPTLFSVGAVTGMTEGMLLAFAVDPSGVPDHTSSHRFLGGLLLGGSAGVATGLLVSRYFSPDPDDYFLTLASSALGASLGGGIAGLARDRAGRWDSLSILGGSTLSLAAGALLATRVDLRGADVFAGSMGLTYGALLGTLAPSLGKAELEGGRTGRGGAFAGLAAGAAAATAVAHALDVPASKVTVPSIAGALGLGMGSGLGLLWPDETRRPEIIASFSGPLLLAGASLALDPALHLSEGLGDSAAPLSAFGGAWGAAEGLLIAGAADPRGLVRSTPSERRWGGALLGVSAGAATGLVLSRFYAPRVDDYAGALAASGLGASLGAGVAYLRSPVAGRWDSVATLGGSSLGMLGGALAAHWVQLDWTDVYAGSAGLGYGALLGALSASIRESEFQGGRRGGGGAMLGLSLGAFGATAASHSLGATPGQVTVPAVAGLAGLGVGAGAGLLVSDPDTWHGARVGELAGTAGFIAGSIIADRWLHLSDGLGKAAPGMSLAGASWGGIAGLWLGGAAHDDHPSRSQRGGASLMLASAGAAGGLALSRFFDPDPLDATTALAASGLGTSMGLGVAQLGWADGHRDLGRILGASLGLAGGAVAVHYTRLRPPDFGAGTAGFVFGGMLGTLAPTLGREEWDGARLASGGALFGMGLGAVGAAAASHLMDASGGQVAVHSFAAGIGLGMGLGAGMMADDRGSRPERMGTFIGPLVLTAASLSLERQLRLADGLGGDAPGLGTLGAVYGIPMGLLLASAVDDSGVMAQTPGSQLFGGSLMGVSAGLASGLVISRYARLDGTGAATSIGATSLGAMLGTGVGLAGWRSSGRHDSLSALSGTAAGIAGGALVARYAPLDWDDAFAATVGLGYGGLIGALSPSLSEPEWSGFTRRTRGWMLVGGSLGAATAVAMRKATGADTGDVLLSTLGGVDGLVTGVGIGLLVDGRTSQPNRIADVVGTAAGLTVGTVLWPRLTLRPGAGGLIAATTSVAAWNGAWLPALDAERLSQVKSQRAWGGLMAGAGLGTMASSVVASAVEVEGDLVNDAVLLDAVASGAGLGTGMLLSTRDDVAVASMLGAGAAGLVAGGVLHRSIRLDDEHAPMLVLSAAEGAWFGSWLPLALRLSEEPTARQTAGGMLGGTLGGAAIGAVFSSAVRPSARKALLLGTTSMLGATISAGGALVSESPDAHQRAAVMLGGTALGLGAGALLEPRVRLQDAALAGGIGAVVGTTEAMTFAWAGRARSSREWMGSGLVGLGVGTSLGLAAAALPELSKSVTPAAAGFAAWGAWMGSFAGALVNSDPHEVTTGGLIGANLAFAGGWALVKTDAVRPGEFGWISLFGAGGTLLGAAAGAPFSNKADSRPILAGLAVGPAVGMVAGVLAMPLIRKATGKQDERKPEPPQVSSGAGAARGTDGTPAVRVADGSHGRLTDGMGIADWTPMVASLPPQGSVKEPATVIGVQGRLW